LEKIIKHKIPEILEALYRPKRVKVLYGGRAGLKSWGAAQALVIKTYDNPVRVLCTRELQSSIKESVHKLIDDTVSRMGMDEFFDIGIAKITADHGDKKAEFIFEGLKNNTTSIKSMENIEICLVEEAEAVTEDSWDILEPTIRAPGSEIWVIFNPDDEMGATYQKFVAPYLAEIERDGFYEDDHIYVRKTSWRDADALGLFPDELRHQMEKMKKDDYRKYLHIWEGEPNTDYEDSIIQPEWVDAAIDSHIKLGWKPRGLKVIGFDVADGGKDAKASAYRHGSLVHNVKSWLDGDMEIAAQRVYEDAVNDDVNTIVYDNIGVGAGVKIKFRALNNHADHLMIEGFSGSEMPSQKKYKKDRSGLDVFRNARAEHIWGLRDRFEATYRAVNEGDYSDPETLISLNSKMPELKMLKAELARIQRKRGYSNSGLIQIESKEDMKKRGLKSPNLFDALFMSFANKQSKAYYSQKPIQYSNARNF